MRDRGISDPAREPSEWLAVLDAVRKATIAERGKDVRADVEIVESILALNNAEARSELLRLHVERLSRQPGRMRAFSSVVANICDNLLDDNAETRPPPELVEKLGDLRAGLAALAPAVADSAGGGWRRGKDCVCFSARVRRRGGGGVGFRAAKPAAQREMGGASTMLGSTRSPSRLVCLS